MEIDLDKILQIYAAESAEHLSAMEEALLGLEADPQDDQLLEAIFRGAHTIKGNSASLGYAKLAGFAHAFEDILQRWRSRATPVDGPQITLLLRAVDAMRSLVTQAIAGQDELGPEQTALLEELTSGDFTAAGKSALSAPAGGDSEAGLRAREEARTTEKNGTVRVDKAKLDRMLDLAGEIAIAQGRLRQALRLRVAGGEEAREAHEQVERLTLGLQEEILQLRMLPLGPTFRHYRRAVRDLAQAQGKIARLELEGEDVEVDVSMAEHLKDPLMHMIRNAVDHGIESPEERRALGKDPCGRIILKARHEGGHIVIQLIDDGAGLDRERIIERARRMKILPEPEKLGDAELFQLIFEPGFSTAAAVTELSGRGVGMDVVRRNIEALRGSITVESRRGGGTLIVIRLPLTLAIIEGFGVGVGVETYILPLHAVAECARMPSDANSRGGLGIIDLRGEPLPFVRLRDWFQLPRANPGRENVVVVEVDQNRVGLAVDALYGTRQTVIKPLGKQLQSLPGIAGSAILGSGKVALILDVAGLVRAVIRSRAGVVAPAHRLPLPALQEFGAASAMECS